MSFMFTRFLKVLLGGGGIIYDLFNLLLSEQNAFGDPCWLSSVDLLTHEGVVFFRQHCRFPILEYQIKITVRRASLRSFLTTQVGGWKFGRGGKLEV